MSFHRIYVEETRLLREWGSLGRIVGFDYGGDNLCLLTAAQGRRRYLFDFPKAEFVQSIKDGKPLPMSSLESRFGTDTVGVGGSNSG